MPGKSDGVEDLRAAIGLVGRYAHLGHDLEQALVDRLDEALDHLVAADRLRQVLRHRGQGLEGEIGVDRFRAVARKTGKVMDLARFAGFDDEADRGPKALADQVMMDGRGREQRRNRNAVRPHHAVREHDDVVAAMHRGFRAFAKPVQRPAHAFSATLGRVGDVERLGVERILEEADAADLLEVFVGEDRLPDFEALVTRGALEVEQVRPRSDERDEAHDQLFADRVDRRVGHLREVLLEVGVEQLRLRRQRGNGRVGPHRTDRLLTGGRHRREQETQVLLGVAEGLLAIEQRHVGAGGARLDAAQVLEHDLSLLQPLVIRVRARQRLLDLGVGHDAVLDEVDKQHLAGLQAPLGDDAFLGNRKHAHLGREHDQIVVGHIVARRPQAVAVEGRADLPAVGEGDRRRPVPRLHQCGVILVEGAPLFVHERIARPGFRDEHHHRVAERIAAAHRGTRARCRSRRCPTALRRRPARASGCRCRRAPNRRSPAAPPSS